jgi:hypothetical protein
MSKKHHLRKDTTCLNCGNIVSDRFCSHCGQENTETRQSFGHLVTHFFEDITHYDSGFWRTMKYLLFRPALLTKEYLSGRRQAFVAPIRLYFFISFICFFLPSVLPTVHDEKITTETKEIKTGDEASQLQKAKQPALTGHAHFRTNLLISEFTFTDNTVTIRESPNDYTSVAQLDSMQKLLPPAERYNGLQYKMAVHTINLFNKYSKEEITEKFAEAFHHNLSKALFVYLPFFAFFIWLFHNKRRWFYYDHAIFSIHYFSFLLLVITVLYIAYWLLDFVRNYDLTLAIFIALLTVFPVWIMYYFYRAHHKFYGERLWISALKSTVLLAINLFFVVFLLLFFTNYTMYTLH